MRRIRRMVVGLAAAATIGTFAACSSDSGTGVGTGGAVDLTGTYSLVSLVLGGILPAPGSSGTLTATADSVHADITIVSPNTMVVPDTTLSLVGSYVAKQTSHGDSVYIVINGLGTIPGGFAISGAAKDTLSLNLVTTAGAFGTTWHKQ